MRTSEALGALPVVHPKLRGLAQMTPDFHQPFVMETAKCDTTIGTSETPLAATLVSYLDPSVASSAGSRE